MSRTAPAGHQVEASRRLAVLTLQIIVGLLVTFGGYAYVTFALNSLGTALGSGHLLLGISGLAAGTFVIAKGSLSRRALLGVNISTIAYSLISDGAAGALKLLPVSAFSDSVVGTAAAVAMSSAIVVMLA